MYNCRYGSAEPGEPRERALLGARQLHHHQRRGHQRHAREHRGVDVPLARGGVRQRQQLVEAEDWDTLQLFQSSRLSFSIASR